jgi:hypothetical protein
MVKIETWGEDEIIEACSFTNIIDKLYKTSPLLLKFSEHVTKPEEFDIWATGFRRKLFELLGMTDMLAQRKETVIVKFEDDEDNIVSDEGSYVLKQFYLKSWLDSLIPVSLGVPKGIKKGEKVPAFVVAHGHSGNKDLLHGKLNNPEKTPYAKEITELGSITISMDQWGWYERGFGGKYNADESKYNLNMIPFDRTINGLRFFDAMRQVDYLLTREDVDPKKIGIAGLSLGGTTAGYTAALDTRIQMAIIGGYINTFKDSIIDKSHCSCNYISGILQYGEMHDIFSLIAPRYACFINGELDMIFPKHSAEKAFNKIKSAYRILNAEDRCVLDMTPLGHKWRGDVAYPFIKKHFFQ